MLSVWNFASESLIVFEQLEAYSVWVGDSLYYNLCHIILDRPLSNMWSIKKVALSWLKCHLLQHVLTNVKGLSLILCFISTRCCLLGWWPSSNSSKRAEFELVKNYTSIISYCSQLPSKFTQAELVKRDHDSHITVSCPLSQRIFCGHEKNLLSEISTFSRYLYNCLKNPF